MRQNNKLGGTKLPSAVMLTRCAQMGMGRAQIADHYGASIKRVTTRLRELALDAPLYGKTWREARFNFDTVVVRRFSSSITLPCPTIYAAALQSRSGSPATIDL